MPNIRYTKSTFVPNEKIIYAARIHKFSFISASLFILAGGFMLMPSSSTTVGGEQEPHNVIVQWLLYFVSYAQYFIGKALDEVPEEMRPMVLAAAHMRSNMIALILVLVGVFNFINAFTRLISTESVVTNKKIIHKRGLMKVDETEIPLNHIEGVKVKQTAFDRLIKRGNILVTGIGMEQMEMKKIADPAMFRNQAYTAIDQYAKH
jgi:uncharacterized membrane protein YdbT with pleckstrin-like domain